MLVAVGLGHAPEAHDHVAGARRVGELKVDVLVALGQNDEPLICSILRMRSWAWAALVGL